MYNILTWNTALTENMENTELTSEIFDYVSSFLRHENAIAVLQQIPYKFKDKDGAWKIHQVYTDFTSAFLDKGFQIIKNDSYNNGYLVMLTVIVTKANLTPLDTNAIYPGGNPTNREAAIRVENAFTLLGLHAKNGTKNLPYIKSINGIADIIVGDFNAGDYPEYQYREDFRKILPTHICVCNLPSKRIVNYKGQLIRESCIDHVFIKKGRETYCSDIKVHNDILWSDHYPVTFCVKSFEDK